MPNLTACANFFPDVTVVSNSAATMLFSGDGTAESPWTFETKINVSGDVGNLLQKRANGLYAGSGTATAITVQDTTSINMSIAGNGGTASPYVIQAVPVISPDIGNALSVRTNGLFATAGAGAGTGYVQGADTNCIDTLVTGTGLVEDPFIISSAPKVSADTGNSVECRADGLYVASGRDVHVHQGEGLATPNPAEFYLWADGKGTYFHATDSRTRWSQANTTHPAHRALSIAGGIVTVNFGSQLTGTGYPISVLTSEFTLLVTSNITGWSFTAPITGGHRNFFRIVMKYDGTPRTVTWPSTWRWARQPSGVPKTPPAPSSTMDIVIWGWADDEGAERYVDWNYYGTAANHP